jgi:hypothetical protein
MKILKYRRAGWYSGDALDLYSGGAFIESRKGYGYPDMFQCNFSVTPGKFRDSNLTRQ